MWRLHGQIQDFKSGSGHNGLSQIESVGWNYCKINVFEIIKVYTFQVRYISKHDFLLQNWIFNDVYVCACMHIDIYICVCVCVYRDDCNKFSSVIISCYVCEKESVSEAVGLSRWLICVAGSSSACFY